jgi:hypothetical protein
MFLFALGTDEDKLRHRALQYVKQHEPSVFYPKKESDLHKPSLSRVEKKLCKGKYTKKPWKFIKHANEAFDHILVNNGKKTTIHQAAVMMKEAFGSKMDTLMVCIKVKIIL